MTALTTTLQNILPDSSCSLWWVFPPDRIVALVHEAKGAAAAYEFMKQEERSSE